MLLRVTARFQDSSKACSMGLVRVLGDHHSLEFRV